MPNCASHPVGRSAALAYIDEFIELHGSAAGELEGDGA